MEVIINRCFGGFGISNEALCKLIKMKSDVVKSISLKAWWGGKIKRGKKICDKYEMCDNFDGIVQDDKKVYLLKDDSKFIKFVRTHKNLIKVIKKLGKKANGGFADLEIVEIPDNINWEIHNYDGMESIEETHRSWS